MKRSPHMLVVVVLAMAVLVSSVAFAAPTRGPDSRGVASERIDGSGLHLETSVAFERAVLTVTGPGQTRIQKTFGPGEAISLGLETDGKTLADGRYSYNLRLSPRSAEGSYKSGLFFVENGRAISRDAKRAELAAVRKNLNQERTKLVASVPEAKPASGEPAVPGPQEAYTIPGPVSIVHPYRPEVTFDRLPQYPYGPTDELASVYGDSRGLWVKSPYVYQPVPAGNYNYSGSIYIDAYREIDLYARYGDVDVNARYDIYMDARYGDIDLYAFWDFDAYGYWIDLYAWQGMYLGVGDGNIYQRASNGKCCFGRSSSPTGRYIPGEGNIVLLAEYDGGYFPEKGSRQGDGPPGYFGGNIYLGSFYFENQIPVKPSAEVGYGEVYAGNINLVAGHIMDYYPGPQATGTGLYGGNTGTIRLTSLYAPNFEVRPQSTPTGIYIPPGVDYTTLAVTPQGVGIGTDDPSAELEIYGADWAAMRLYSAQGGNEWTFATTPSGSITINQIGTGGQEVSVRERFDGAGPTLTVQGSVRGTQFIATSSRDMKTDFAELNAKEMLATLADVPVMSWRYRTEDEETRHVGPVAEDFSAAFQLGDGGTISSVDANGVTMAAIQGLHQLLKEQQAELEEKDSELTELKRRLALLEKRVDGQPADG